MNSGTGEKMTPRCARVLDSAAELAHEMNHQHIGVEHIFLAIIRDRHAVPTQVLADLIDLGGIESRLRDVMNSASYSTPTRIVHGHPNARDLEG